MIGSKFVKGFVRAARAHLRDMEATMLESAGWSAKKSDYYGTTSWYHPDVGLISRSTAVALAMGEVELD